MKGLWYFSGRAAFWLSWPLLFLFLASSRRTRILVVNGNDVLVVRGWLSSGRWGLPGGGLHRGEDPAEGAVRELKEETGIDVKATKLQKLYSGKTKTGHGLRYIVYAYALELGEKPALARQKFELTHLEWTDWRTLIKSPETVPDVHEVVSAFFQDGKVN